MGSIQSVNCFERWGKRGTGGALLTLKKKSTVESSSTRASASGVGEASGDTEKANTRASRRRPSVAPPQMESDISDISDDRFSVVEEDLSLEDSDEDVSVHDIHTQKIAMYRKSLTKILKLKFGFFSSTVRMTVDKTATNLEWYNAKEKRDKSKLLGSVPLDKVKRIQQNSAKPNILEISQTGKAETYNLIFKSSEDRAAWEESFSKLLKFVANMK